MAATEAEIRIVERNLIKTLDKGSVLATLRTWRKEAVNNIEADLLTDLIAEVDSGEHDG